MVNIQANNEEIGSRFHPLGSDLENPYPFFSRARKEVAIFFSEELHMWVVSRYDDIKAILLQPKLYSNRDTVRPLTQFAPKTLEILQTGYPFVLASVNADGEDHKRLRVPLHAAFAPRRVAYMQYYIRSQAQKQIATFQSKHTAEILTEYASPFTLSVLLSIFGIPEEDMLRVRKFCDAFLTLLFRPMNLDNEEECALQEDWARGTVEFQRYCAELAGSRGRDPQGDFISELLRGQLDQNELIMSLAGTLIAGYETTANLIGNALALLLSQPERWQAICTDPSFIPTVVEEVLRFETSLPYFIRTVVEDSLLGEVTMHAGDLVLLVYASANHDERHFHDAEQFVMDRSPNEHLAFGAGPHFCPGSALARQEVIIALEELCVAFPSLRLRERQQLDKHIQSLRIRGLQRLDVVW